MNKDYENNNDLDDWEDKPTADDIAEAGDRKYHEQKDWDLFLTSPDISNN